MSVVFELYHSIRVFEVQAVERGNPFRDGIALCPLSHTRHFMESSGGMNTTPHI